MSKSNSKNGTKYASIRIKMETKKKAKILRDDANKKKGGRKIKFDDLFDLAISLVQPDHILMLGPYRADTLHFIPETSFTLFESQKGHLPVQL